jgi:DNA-binding response OmpR family regulator
MACMKYPQNYVLVLTQDADDLKILEALLNRLSCPVVIACSAEQAMTRASEGPPYLIILAGNQQNWSKALVNRFRSTGDACGMTIVALTERHAPSWLRQEENPGLDGFLVKPLNCDVLVSLVQSAWVRQTCCASS